MNNIDTLQLQLYAYNKKPDSMISLKLPNFIRRALIYNPTARENDPEITNKISQEKIRSEIQNYFRSMNIVLDGNNEFEAVIFNIREFIRLQKLHNVSGWFESDRILNMQTSFQIIRENDLLLLSKDPDFQQLLFESNLKLNEVKRTLENLIVSNKKLITQIESYIAN